MVAKCGSVVIWYINLQIIFHPEWLHLLGLQWVGLCEVYLIEAGNIVKFTYVAADHWFHVEVRDMEKHVKPFIH